ncbi:hypothetical protein C8035_v007070 [Colletotrichum spinosum]|uniref:Uncharacterized protein n=1 Tax=Colletotrichum spinosum TaxID=1347390 RepID=A0A4R8QLZ4_9PEZI|nr:hypothetical protein C8035_v007070 [Colletotrichum spinosum]
MGDERDTADITLQLLAKAGEIKSKEQGTTITMPSTTLASRLRSGNNAPTAVHANPSPQPNLGNRKDGSTWQSRHGEPEGRGRQKNITEASLTSGVETSHGSREQPVPPQTSPTDDLRKLGPLPVRRSWVARPGLPSPDISRRAVLEAVMLHERGQVQPPDQRCTRCRRGEGFTPECVKIAGISNNACSNCLMARALANPRGSDPATAAVPRPTRSYSAERRSISAAIPPSIPKEDLIAVWNLIAGVISAQPQDCVTPDDDADGTEMPGKRIEDAARLVARSADEWGHTVEEEGPGSAERPTSAAERSRLARQASRIRETALQIANCARDWGEKLQKKRSTSRLRS